MTDLRKKRCQSCEGIGEKLSNAAIKQHQKWVHADWTYTQKPQSIQRSFHFSNHYETIAFVNAVSWISHTENHHPEMTVGYADCSITYSTHALGGLSENDFICASKVDALISHDDAVAN